MSRSVNIPSGSVAELYFEFDGYDDWMENSNLWSDMIDNLQSLIHSVDEDNRFYAAGENKWMGREGRIISTCEIAQVVISEYCGLCSLAVVPKDEPDDGATQLIKKCWEDFSAEWSRDFFDRLQKKLIDDGWPMYNKSGTFSNGEGVYTKVVA